MKISLNTQVLPISARQNTNSVSFRGSQPSKSDSVEISEKSLRNQNQVLTNRSISLEKKLSNDLAGLKLPELVREYSAIINNAKDSKPEFANLCKSAEEVFGAFRQSPYNNFFIINSENKELATTFIDFIDMHAKNSNIDSLDFYKYYDFKKISAVENSNQFFAQINEAISAANEQNAKTGKKTLLHFENFAKYLDPTANNAEDISKVKNILNTLATPNSNIKIIFTSPHNQNLEVLFEDIRNHNWTEIRKAFDEPRFKDLLRQVNKTPTESEIQQIIPKVNSLIGAHPYVGYNALPELLPRDNYGNYPPITLEVRAAKAYPQRFELPKNIKLSDFEQHKAFFKENEEAFGKITSAYNSYAEEKTKLRNEGEVLSEQFRKLDNETENASTQLKKTADKAKNELKKLSKKQITGISITAAAVFGLITYFYKKNSHKSTPSNN